MCGGRAHRYVAAVFISTRTDVHTLRVGIVDASYDSMPQILRAVRDRYPGLEIYQVEAGVPEQFRLLADGRLDVGLGRASLAPSGGGLRAFRLDPAGRAGPRRPPFRCVHGRAGRHADRGAATARRRAAGPEFNQFEEVAIVIRVLVTVSPRWTHATAMAINSSLS